MEKGMTVKIKLNQMGEVVENTYHNVTEIHYKYDGGVRCAFESDIHCTGTTHEIADIVEMETRPATKVYPEF